MIENENLTAPEPVMPEKWQQMQNERYARDLEAQKRQQRAAEEELQHRQKDDAGFEPKPLTDAERGAEVLSSAVETLPESHEVGFGERVKKSIIAKFLGKHSDEYENFAAKERERVSVPIRFNEMRSRLEGEQNRLAALRVEVAAHKGLDIAAGAAAAAKTNQTSLFLIFMAPAVTAQIAVKTYGQAIVDLTEKTVLELEREFTAYKKKNSAILRELGLI